VVYQMKQQLASQVSAPPNLEGEDLEAFYRNMGHLYLCNYNQVRGTEWELY